MYVYAFPSSKEEARCKGIHCPRARPSRLKSTPVRKTAMSRREKAGQDIGQCFLTHHCRQTRYALYLDGGTSEQTESICSLAPDLIASHRVARTRPQGSKLHHCIDHERITLRNLEPRFDISASLPESKAIISSIITGRQVQSLASPYITTQSSFPFPI